MADWDQKVKVSKDGFDFFWKGLKNYWELLGEEKMNMVKVVLGTVVTQLLALVFAFMLKLIFDRLPDILVSRTIDIGLILLMGATLLVTLVNDTFRFFVKERRFIKSTIRLENTWPMLAQKKLLALSSGFHERENIGKKISKIEKGCDRLVQLSMDLMWGTLPQLFYLILNLIIIMFLDWRLGLVFFLPFVPVLWIGKKFYQRFESGWEQWEIKKELSSGYFCQSLINVKTVQDYVQEKYEEERLGKVRRFMQKLDTDINLAEQYYFYAMRVILDVFYVLTIALGIYFIFQGSSTVGMVVYLIATGNVTIETIHELFHNYSKILRHMVPVNRMKELLDQEIDIPNDENAQSPKTFDGRFELESINFVYPGKENAVLNNLNLTIESGEMVAFVGRSGEGKTTVVKLLARVYDVTAGNIKLDGTDIRTLDLAWYRKHFAVVQQDVDIFDTSLRDNVRYAYPEANEQSVLEAIEAAHLQVILNDKRRFPDGLDTQVGERGVRLSGGEKQRVSIARAYLALLHGARVLILDEATSSLDSEAEKAIQSMISRIRKTLNITIVVIAHRLSTIRMADNIYVLGDGEVIEQGSHEKLLQGNGLYSRLVEMQSLGSLRE